MSFEFGKLYQEWSYEQYDAKCRELQALRSSHLKPLRKSPAHLRARLEGSMAESEAFRQGKLVHKFLENPEKFMETHVVEPKFVGKTKDGRDSERSAEAKVAKAQWYSDLKDGTIVLREDDVPMIKGIARTVREHGMVRNLLKEGVSETSLWVQEVVNGVAVSLACRPDFIAKQGYIIDLKTTRSAHPDDFISDIFSDKGYHYILQASLYARCARLAGLARPDSFTFVAIEKEPPYCLNVFPLDHGCLAVGDSYVDKLVETYAQCIDTGKWPGYSNKAVPVTIPTWVGWGGDQNV